MPKLPAVWFPTIRTNTGTDVFTERLAKELKAKGIQTEITWLPLRAEYAPWSVPIPKPPAWANIVHVNTWLHPRFLPKQLPIVATIHHSVHHPDASSYKSYLRAAYHKHWVAPIERRTMQRADKVIAVSQFVAETARYTLTNVPMKVIYNGIDTSVFKPGNRARAAGAPFQLLYVGSWSARKGVDLLEPIMQRLGHDFELRYTSGAPSSKNHKKAPSNMKDIGRLNGDAEVAKAMQNSDALLFPSRSEGFGLVAAEAIACGIPVIATRGSSLTEVIKNHNVGFLCPQNDIVSFVKAIQSLAKAPLKIPEDYIENHFSLEKNTKSYICIYKETLAKSPSLKTKYCYQQPRKLPDQHSENSPY